MSVGAVRPCVARTTASQHRLRELVYSLATSLLNKVLYKHHTVDSFSSSYVSPTCLDLFGAPTITEDGRFSARKRRRLQYAPNLYVGRITHFLWSISRRKWRYAKTTLSWSPRRHWMTWLRRRRLRRMFRSAKKWQTFFVDTARAAMVSVCLVPSEAYVSNLRNC